MTPVSASDVVRGKKEMKALIEKGIQGSAFCPICTHTVGTEVEQAGRKIRVVPGQKCPRCASTLDVAAVVEILEAA